MYIQNRRNSCKFKGCSPLQNCNGLISLKPAIAYIAYTKRYAQFKKKPPTQTAHLVFLPTSLRFKTKRAVSSQR